MTFDNIIEGSKDKYLYDYEETNEEMDSNIHEYDRRISIIIPVYNEEKSIKKVIETIPNHNDYEIIVVNDGSTDNTLEKLREIERKIKIINHDENRGYGASILTGFGRATGELIITMDSDGQHDPREIPSLLLPIIGRQADIVIGSRYLGKSNYKVPLHTRLGEYIVKLCLWILFHQKIGNNQSGFRAFNKKSIEILNDMIYTKFGLCTETLFKAAHNNLRIIEMPITINLREYGTSRVRVVKILKSIGSCVLLYLMVKLETKRILPKTIYYQLKKKLKKFFEIG